MTTGFAAEPAQVAGFGEMAGEQGQRMLDLANLVDEARLTEGVSGLLTSFQGPVDAYADAANDRVFDQGALLTSLAETLNRASWVYTGKEESTYRDIRDIGGHPTTATPIRDFPRPVRYAPGDAPDVTAPGHETVDLMEVVDEIGGSIKIIEQVLDTVFGWSLTEAITEPIAGNYTELSRAGEILIQAGYAAEQNAANLTAGLSTLERNWSGGAAESCAEYVRRVANAIDYERPLNRVVGEVYQVVADEFEFVGDFVATSLKSAIDKIVSAAASSSIPVAGWAVGAKRAIDAAKAVWHIVEEARAMVDSLKTLLSQVEAVTAAASGEVNDLQELSEAIGTFGGEVCATEDGGSSEEECAAEDKEDNAAKRTSEALHDADVAQDVTKIAKNMDDFENMPDEGFKLGAPRRPDA